MSCAVIAYSVVVLGFVASSGDLGIRCVLGTQVKDNVAAVDRWRIEPDPGLRAQAARDGFAWSDHPPNYGDRIVRIGGQDVAEYTDYVKALYRAHQRIGDWVQVRWRDAGDGNGKVGEVRVARRSLGTYVWSLIWFLQEMGIFYVGARVFWRRPGDESARRFFWLCVATVGAFMGGYHWSEIVIYPPLIFPFAAFAIFVPVVSLHFYLVFPRPSPVFEAHRRRVLAVLYGVPSAFLVAIWSCMLWSRSNRDVGGAAVHDALRAIRFLALAYVAIAVAIFGLSLAYLIHNFLRFRAAGMRAERNQVRWILLATLLSTPCVVYLILDAIADPANLGRDRSAWPMFLVSLLYTLAYAISITRYKLMHAEEIFNRSVAYFLVSVSFGLVYSAVLVAGTLVVGWNLRDIHTWRAALVAGGTVAAILILGASEAARQRFQRAIDRRFSREKYKFDQAMEKMRLVVGSLVDRPALGKRLLDTAAEFLRLEWGAIYLRGRPDGPFELVAWQGTEPDDRALAAENPLVVRLAATPSIRLPRAMDLAGGSDPATDAMIALGGEVAYALAEADGGLAGLLVLGPKRSGLPFEDDEVAFLGGLGSMATLSLHSADIQRTLEVLNQELRDKVEKITEQQRRILILQDQLLDRGDHGTAAVADGRAPGAPTDPAEAEAFGRIKGSSLAVKQMRAVARKVAASPSSVLVLGESGTGKELLAEAIHAASPRAGGPFVQVHCAALSPTLLESELFGHVKSAFTGADRDRVGRFQLADGGTIFLDEIGDVTLEVQTKLLRVLQTRSFERVGSSQPIAVDVRVMAATHQDLEAMIREGRFRADLFYRLNVITLRTPALRDRKEDIFELAVYFLGVHARRAGKGVTHLDDEAIEALIAYDWPGNIRELENVVERAVVLADGPALTRADLSPEVLGRPTPRRRARRGAAVAVATATPRAPAAVPDADGDAEPDDAEFREYERQRLLDALREADGNKSEAARLLLIPRSTFFSKLRKYNLI
ncbi:MAG TPA: sigma 54-interacting transcriptional regulator [Isosphaeraceae bacterium]|nr:sigma 54-interacting transcriptional regulator [Isosphaeraceae bacterium]